MNAKPVRIKSLFNLCIIKHMFEDRSLLYLQDIQIYYLFYNIARMELKSHLANLTKA